MNEEHIDIQTAVGIMPTFTSWPEGDGPFPAFMFVHNTETTPEFLQVHHTDWGCHLFPGA